MARFGFREDVGLVQLPKKRSAVGSEHQPQCRRESDVTPFAIASTSQRLCIASPQAAQRTNRGGRISSEDKVGFGLRRVYGLAIVATLELHFLMIARNRHPVAAHRIRPQRENIGLERRKHADGTG